MPSAFVVAAETTVGPVSLTVSDLDRAGRFYRDILGLTPLRGELAPLAGGPDPAAGPAGPSPSPAPLVMTADGETPLLFLHGRPGARPKPERSSGLYHAAILVPDRAALARSLLRLHRARYPLQGAADHRVSEALYLADPDGNGLEIYRDRARDSWTDARGAIRMTTEPLDFDGMLAAAGGDGRAEEGLPPATRIGHVHLVMSDLGRAEEFYSGLLGFEVTLRAGGVALFVSAGGYHHHIGLNVFAGAGLPPPPPDAAGLRHFAVALPDRGELERLTERVRAAGVAVEHTPAGPMIRDPAHNALLLTVREREPAPALAPPASELEHLVK